MNRGIWLFLEVCFDTVMFAPYLLRGRFSLRVKAQILLTYLRVSVKLLLVHPFRPITQERVWGFTVQCFDYRTMHLLFRVILLRNEYYFETSTERPVIFDCGASVLPRSMAPPRSWYSATPAIFVPCPWVSSGEGISLPAVVADRRATFKRGCPVAIPVSRRTTAGASMGGG